MAGGVNRESAGGTSLSPTELQYYNRHIIMPEIGLKGQERLRRGSVLIVGAGGLGSPTALYLAAAGIGRIGLVDSDVVDRSNLHRQVLYTEEDIGRSKLVAAKERLSALNPHIEVDTYETTFRRDNAIDLLRDYEILVDGTDNFPTRYLSNDAAVLSGKPNVYGSIFRFEGQASVFDAKRGPCYRCLYPQPPPPGLVPSCAEGGVLGILPAIIGSIQATEALKILLGIGDPLIGRLLLYDALGMSFTELAIRKNPNCPVCGTNPTVTELIDYEEFCGLPGAHAEAAGPAATPGLGARFDPDVIDVPAATVAARRKAGDVVIIDVREPYELQIAAIEGAATIPLGQLPGRTAEIPRDRDVVMVCHTGGRRGRATRFLRAQGFERVWNLAGGVAAWADEVDPTMATY
ncbi:MAG: molybdopterin-synthase adenylyltransferase MoeB [Thermoplasmatota archaeon]